MSGSMLTNGAQQVHALMSRLHCPPTAMCVPAAWQVWDMVPAALQEALSELVEDKDDDAVAEAEVGWGARGCSNGIC